MKALDKLGPDERTNERRSAFIGLLSEPKRVLKIMRRIEGDDSIQYLKLYLSLHSSQCIQDQDNQADKMYSAVFREKKHFHTTVTSNFDLEQNWAALRFKELLETKHDGRNTFPLSFGDSPSVWFHLVKSSQSSKTFLEPRS